MHISRSAVYQDGGGTMGSALWFAVWWQSYLQSGRGLGTQVTAAAAHSGWHKDIRCSFTPCSQTQVPPSVLLPLHGSPVPARICILRVANFSARALRWWWWILPTAGTALQMLCVNRTFDKHLDAVFIRLPDEIFSLPFSSLNKCIYHATANHLPVNCEMPTAGTAAHPAP